VAQVACHKPSDGLLMSFPGISDPSTLLEKKERDVSALRGRRLRRGAPGIWKIFMQSSQSSKFLAR